MIERSRREHNVAQFPPPRPDSRVSWWGILGAVAATTALVGNAVWGTRTLWPDAGPRPRGFSARLLAGSYRLTPGERRAIEVALGGGPMPIPERILVDDQRPTLTWRPFPDAIAYQVTVLDAATPGDVVARSGWQPGTTWTVDRPLTRGADYRFRVSARTANGFDPVDVGREDPPFRLTDADRHAALAAIRARAGASHVALGVLLAESGVRGEAERELTLAAADFPRSTAVARLLAHLRALGPRL